MSSETKESPLPAIALRCRVCQAEHELGPHAVCPRDFGPLDPVYDWDVLRRTVSRLQSS